MGESEIQPVFSFVEMEISTLETGLVTLEITIFTEEMGLVTVEMAISTEETGLVTLEMAISTEEMTLVTAEMGLVKKAYCKSFVTLAIIGVLRADFGRMKDEITETPPQVPTRLLTILPKLLELNQKKPTLPRVRLPGTSDVGGSVSLFLIGLKASSE